MRVYDAQDIVFKRRRTPLTMGEARDIAAKLFAHFGLDPIVVQRTRGNGYGSWFRHAYKGKPAAIHLANDAPDWLVAHEVAHYATWVLHGENGHGRVFAATYVEAVGVVISGTYAARLANAFARVGLLPKD